MSTDNEKAQVDPTLIAEVVSLMQGRVISKFPKGFWKDKNLLKTILEAPFVLDRAIACSFSAYERQEFGRKNDVLHQEPIPPSPKLVAEVVAFIQGRVVSRIPRSLWEDQELLEDFLHTPSRLDQIIAGAFSEYERKKLLAEEGNTSG